MSIQEQLQAIIELAEMEGLSKLSPEFQFRISDFKVKECQKVHGLLSCGQCPRQEECEVLDAHIKNAAARITAQIP